MEHNWRRSQQFQMEQMQGRRHGYDSGGQFLRAEPAEKFFHPHFLASGGQNIA